jgi:hypothetical protein
VVQSIESETKLIASHKQKLTKMKVKDVIKIFCCNTFPVYTVFLFSHIYTEISVHDEKKG